MISKKSLIFFLSIILFSGIVMAQAYKLEISTIKESFSGEENITFIINLYDSSNNPIEAEIPITIEDIKKTKIIEKTVSSKKLTSIDLENSLAGEWTINAQFGDTEATESFFIAANEKVKLELEGEVLTITNIGNIIYTPYLEISIGNTIGVKEPRLGIGEKVSYRLIAPEGVYNIRVVDQNNPQTSLTMSNVELSGKGLTGKTVGIIDEKASQRSPLTGGISPEEEADDALLSYLRGSKFIYVFVLVIFGAMILLAIERRFRKKAQ